MKRLLSLALLVSIFYFTAKYTKIYNVTTASMEPTIKAGSIVAVFKTQQVKLGDVVTYKTPQNTEPITHRIIKVQNIHGKIFYTTKGDSNKTEDPYPVSQEEIIGKVIFVLPYLGLILKSSVSYKFLSITFYFPLGFFFGQSARKLSKLAATT